MQPLVDSSLIPLPFLVFKDGQLSNWNEGARTLLLLQQRDGDGVIEDGHGDGHTFDELFPSSLPGSPIANRLEKGRHLQVLRARVHGSVDDGGVLVCKAAVYETPEGQKPAVRSILIVDVAVNGLHDVSDGDGFEVITGDVHDQYDHIKPTRVPSSSASSFNPSRETSVSSTVTGTPHRPHLSQSIKRHSGDIRKIWTSTVERRKAERSEKNRFQGGAAGSGTGSSSSNSNALGDHPNASDRPGPAMFPISTASAPRMTGSVSASSSMPRSNESSLHRKRPSEPNISIPSNLWTSTAPPAPASGASPVSPKQGNSNIPPALPTRNSNSGESSSASTRSKASTTFFANAAAASVAETADFSLAQSALSAHPRTGIIISKADLSSGFINSRTRELLMGVKSPTDEYSTDPFDNMWYSQQSARERKPAEEGQMGTEAAAAADRRRARMQAKQERRQMRHSEREERQRERERHDPSSASERDIDTSSSDDQGTAIDGEPSPVWEDEIIFQDGKVRIDLPDRGENLQTSVSDILRWSLRRRRVRQQHRAMREDVSSIRSGRSGSIISPPASVTASSTSTAPGQDGMPAGGPRASLPMTAREAEHIMKTLTEEERPWIAHKPYKVYDAAFSQRVEDPFEQLFDQAVRRGDPSAAEHSVIVGIETEVGPAETCLFPENECFIHASESGGKVMRTRVRRRVVQARAAPLRDMNGDHIGGVVWLRDITGETGAPAPNPTVHPDAQPQEASKAIYPPGSAPPAVSAMASSPGFQGPAGLDGVTFWQHVINNMAQCALCPVAEPCLY